MPFTSFFLNTYRAQLILAALVFGGISYLCVTQPAFQEKISWFDPIVEVGLLFFAILLWLNGILREWKNSLPKRLTAQFQYQGRNVMVCHDALLVNEGDARTWALQIGQQMSGCQRLKFEPFFNLQERGIQKEKTTGKQYKAYIFTYYLTELPVPDNATPEIQAEFKRQLETGCLERYPIYNADGTISTADGYTLSKPKMTVSE